MIKTYRGSLDDGAEVKIRLKTNKGDIGYRIVKFQLMGHNPGDASSGSYEHVVQIFKTRQVTSSVAASATIDFEDGELLAAGLCFSNTSPHYNDTQSIVFDNEIFNQDIYITHVDEDAATPVNYYLELEQIKLSENQTTMATLQSIRMIAEPGNPF